MAKKEGKIYFDPEIGEVVFRKSIRNRSMSIRVHPVKGVMVSVPYIMPYMAAIAFFKSRREWVLEIMTRQREKYRDVKVMDPQEVEELRKKAKSELPSRLAEFADRYGFKYNRVVIKNNATNWGSCSTKGNINLNLKLMKLPGVLQDYVLLHELTHLRHPDHGQAFHLLLEHLCTDHILRLADEGDPLAKEIAYKATLSKSRYPLDKVITRKIASYRTF